MPTAGSSGPRSAGGVAAPVTSAALQLAVPGDVSAIPSGWWLERKLDGMRLLVRIAGGAVSLWTRNGQSCGAGFPELTAALGATGASDLTADGEVVAFDGDRTSFARLQRRMGVRDPVRASRSGVAVQLHLFDLLTLDGRDRRDEPLRVRAAALAEAVRFDGPLHRTDHASGDPQALLREACHRGWEGLVAKDPDAPYRAGRATSWRKLPCQRGQEFVVGGWTDPSSGRTGFGALLLGTVAADGLRYAGKVGTGFGETELQALSQVLGRLERPHAPFVDPPHDRGLHWVEPRLVVQVAFTEWTREGRLRQPRYTGLRLDRDPHDVVREPDVGRAPPAP